MTNYKEIKEKVERIAEGVKRKSPQSWYDKIEEVIEKNAKENPFFLLGNEQAQIENIYKAFMPYMIYDMSWEVGDVLIDENGMRYTIIYDESMECNTVGRYALLNNETCRFTKKVNSIKKMQSELKNEKEFAGVKWGLQLVDIKKKKEWKVSNV